MQLVSALFFGVAHLLRITLGNPFPQTMLLVVSASLGGILYAAIVLYGGSVWSVIELHGTLNALAGIQAINMPGFKESVPAWALVILLQAPLVLLAMTLIQRTPARAVVPEAA